MTAVPKKSSRMERAILETAEDMRQGGLMDEETYERITLRHLGDQRAIEIPIPSGDDIRAMRHRANLSQAVFARKLNLTPGYISQLERGVKRPTGAAVVLLNLIKKRGIDAIS